jgi:hypothetical protein
VSTPSAGSKVVGSDGSVIHADVVELFKLADSESVTANPLSFGRNRSGPRETDR